MMGGIQLVIPAAGAGSRFRSIGVKIPKPLISVGNMPMILWVLGNFPLEKQDKVIIVGQQKDQLPKMLEPFLTRCKSIVEFIEINGLTDGPASTIELSLPFLNLNEPVIVANSDQFVSKGVDEFTKSMRNRQFDGTILTMNASGNKWSYVRKDLAGKVTEVVEKLQISKEATVGIYGWSTAQLLADSIEYLITGDFKVNGEYYIAPSYNYLVSTNKSIGTFSVGNHGDSVHGLGTPEDLDDFLADPRFATLASNLAMTFKH